MKLTRFYGLLALCALMCFTAPLGFAEDTPFVTVWKVDANNLTVKLPMLGTYKLKYKAEGATEYSTENEVTASWATGDDKRHELTFPAAGVYEVVATGVTGLYAYDIKQEQRDCLTQLKSWGNAKWKTLSKGLAGCTNMTIAADAGKPDLSDLKDIDYLFAACKMMNSETLKEWDVSKIENFKSALANCSLFNQDISAWDVSSAKNLETVFAGCEAFNQNLAPWGDKVTNVTSMLGLFSQAKSFNGDLSTWKVGNVTDMKQMFQGAEAFTGDISKWDVSKVTNMVEMFSGAKLFDCDLKDWNVASVEDMAGMFKNCEKFNGNISGWNVSNVLDMENILMNCTAFNHTIKDWDLTKLVTYKNKAGKQGQKKIGIQNVAYTEAMLEEIITTWMNRKNGDDPVLSNKKNAAFQGNDKKGLTIDATGLYCTEAFESTIETLGYPFTRPPWEASLPVGDYWWTVTVGIARKGMFEFTPATPLIAEVKTPIEMPSFEGRFLSHRDILLTSEDISTVNVWKVYDSQKIDKDGGQNIINENTDYEIVAIFKKEGNPEDKKHFVYVNVFGSGQGTVTGNLGGTEVTGTGVFEVADVEKADVGKEETELTIKADENSTFRYYMVRFENNQEEEDITKPVGDKTTHKYNPMGYYRFGGTGDIKIKVPKSAGKNISIDVVFDSKDMQEAGSYNLYFSKVGPGTIKADMDGTNLVMGKNNIPLDGKNRLISYTIEKEDNATVDRVLVFQKDTRLRPGSIGETSLSVTYRERLISSGNGEEKDPAVLDSRKLKVKVNGVKIKGLQLILPDVDGKKIGTEDNPYIWYVGKSLTEDFARDEKNTTAPRLVYEPANTSEKTIKWTLESDGCDDAFDKGSLVAKVEPTKDCLISCKGVAEKNNEIKVEFIAKIEQKRVTEIKTSIRKEDEKKLFKPDGTGIELNRRFQIIPSVEPVDAYVKDVTLTFDPADAIKVDVETQSDGEKRTLYTALKKGIVKVTMTTADKKKGSDEPSVVLTREFEIWKTEVTGIEFENPDIKEIDSISIATNEYELKANVLPLANITTGEKGATIREIKYELSDTAVMKFTRTPGVFKLVKVGTCVITVISIDNTSIKKSVKVVVYDPNQKKPEEDKGGSVEDAIFAGVRIAPNPFGAQLSIQNGALYGSFELLNLNGQVLRQGKMTSELTTFDTADLPAGAYLLRLTVEGASKTFRVVKK